MTALSAFFVVSKDRHFNSIVLRCGDLQLSFAEFDAAAARVAALLARDGIGPGDRVGLMLPNTLAFAIAFYGIMYRGAVAVPMNPLLKGREVSYYLSNRGAKALFATPAFADEASAGAAEAGAHCWLVDDADLMDLIAEVPGQDQPVERDEHDVALTHRRSRLGGPLAHRLSRADTE
jgi:long-chain acyl-CoA synthetase